MIRFIVQVETSSGFINTYDASRVRTLIDGRIFVYHTKDGEELVLQVPVGYTVGIKVKEDK